MSGYSSTEWIDSRRVVARPIRSVLAPPDKILYLWAGPPEVGPTPALRARLMDQLAQRGLVPVLLFERRGLSTRAVAVGQRAQHALSADMAEAGDEYWFGYDVYLSTPSQDLEALLIQDPDGTDIRIALWGRGSEGLGQALLSLLRTDAGETS